MNWDLELPNDIASCEDIKKSLELSMKKLEESNAYMRSFIEKVNDDEVEQYIEENELILRRKAHQIQQLRSHIESINRPNESN